MRKFNLATQVLIAFVIGTVLGIIFQKDILFLQPVGDIFLRLIQMIVVPLIFFSIIGGIANIGISGTLANCVASVPRFWAFTSSPRFSPPSSVWRLPTSCSRARDSAPTRLSRQASPSRRPRP